MSIEHLQSRFGGEYSGGAGFLSELALLESSQPAAGSPAEARAEWERRFEELKTEALVHHNPCLDFDEILAIRRDPRHPGLPQNWQGNTSINPRIPSELIRLQLKNDAPPATVYKPADSRFVGDINLHFDASRLLFSSLDDHGRWQVFELPLSDPRPVVVTPQDHPDIDNYNGIYLPDGRIIYCSTSSFVGVPCVGGSDAVANLHLLGADRKSVRRLCFDQDHNWYPTLLPDGRVMFLRWEYTDSAHYYSRVLMTMNPDGTGQIGFYGSNSYWPNSLFYARPLPGESSRFAGIVSGHHGVARMGELVVFDATRGRSEATGAVQRIPGYGKKVEAPVIDRLADDVWPRYLHPVPVSDTYFLVACQPSPRDGWGIYLVDTFDNRVLIHEEKGQMLLEPVPLRRSTPPPVIPDRVDPSRTTATVSIQDIHQGTGLPGVPRGTVKALRIFEYVYSYRNMGGHYDIGMEGPWDVRRLIGTVPVEPDGSAHFEIPANTPISLQPLDAAGMAIQQKRSWLTAMPGERVSCMGCHDNPNHLSPPAGVTLALQKPAAQPEPWHGPTRGFSFLREVQPVLDKHCVGCHDGTHADRPRFDQTQGRFPQSYNELHPYVRRNGPEGDYHVLTPLEFHASTSDLVQMLRKGHHQVALDAEAWDRLITWIDLNVPAHGTWREAGRIPANFEQRRREMDQLYANTGHDIEAVPNPYTRSEAFIPPPPANPVPAPPVVPGWPFTAEAATARQQQVEPCELRIDLGNQQGLTLRAIPAGEFAMGDANGYPDESPVTHVRIDKPFWMATTEVSLAQYQCFDPDHRNGHYDMHYKDQVKPGYAMDSPDLPVIRVSWQQANAFCEWLSKRSGRKVRLPTEAQWEWAARAGSDRALWFGDTDADFSRHANLADASLKQLAVSGVDPQPIPNPGRDVDFVPKDARFNDGYLHLAPVTSHLPNPWGLHHLHGNVAEWTRDSWHPYPYAPGSASDPVSNSLEKTVRGGSWRDRPQHARSAFRQSYLPWQKVYNTGFRVIVEE